MKKYIIFSVTALVAASLFTACGNDHEDEPTVSKYITVSTQIGQMTRVSTLADGSQVFDEGDEISVYAWTDTTENNPTLGMRVVDNATNKLSGNKWIATPQMLWSDQTTRHYFIGIYPKTPTSVSDLSAMPYTLNTANQDASDLLIATNLSGLTATDNPVALLFDHVMGKMIVNLTFRNQFEGTPTIDNVVVKDMATSATVNCRGKSVTAGATKSDITLPATTTASQYASVVIPQTGIRTIVITINGKDYTYTHNEDIALESGKYTTVNLIVGRDAITLGSVSINDWQKGKEISGGEAL